MKTWIRIALAIAAAAPGAGALAQPGPAPQPCELHLWPAERMSSTTTGLLSGFGVAGAIADVSAHAGRDASNRSQMASALDSPSQLDALQSLDLITELGLPAGTAIVRHEAPLDRRTMNRVKTRRSDSTARCYYELITADVAYQRSTIYGRSLRTLFMIRDFGDDQEIDFEYKSWGGNGLSHFPPREGEDVGVAIQELVDVFKRNFQEYAHNERNRRAERTRGRRR
ncbi:MAG: hypothetical protein QOH47_1597 [Sphingomonadales bacterium]|jgi:hypothetical protein|nr:hypothetical protein [Sphingomonadales bacterium]